MRQAFVAGRSRAAEERLGRAGSLPPATGAFVNYTDTVTATADAATAHTVGAWQELIASTSDDSDLLALMLMVAINQASVATDVLLNVGVGAAGAEVPIVSGLVLGYRTVTGCPLLLPLSIPKGSRVAIQIQSVFLGKTCALRAVFLRTGAPTSPSSLLSYGVNTALSRGTVLTAAAVGVEGAWTQIGVTAEPLSAVIATWGNSGNSQQAGDYLIDLGFGAVGQETAVVSNIQSAPGTNEDLRPYWNGPFAFSVPAGTRLVARFQRGNTANNCTLAMHGIRRMS